MTLNLAPAPPAPSSLATKIRSLHTLNASQRAVLSALEQVRADLGSCDALLDKVIHGSDLDANLERTLKVAPPWLIEALDKVIVRRELLTDDALKALQIYRLLAPGIANLHPEQTPGLDRRVAEILRALPPQAEDVQYDNIPAIVQIARMEIHGDSANISLRLIFASHSSYVISVDNFPLVGHSPAKTVASMIAHHQLVVFTDDLPKAVYRRYGLLGHLDAIRYAERMRRLLEARYTYDRNLMLSALFDELDAPAPVARPPRRFPLHPHRD